MTALSSSSTESDISALDFGDLETAVDNALGQIGNSVQRLNATKASIGAQSATAMLAQLNMAPQQVLQLLNS
jgi:flagellin-like hook-associated protein FlgL